MNGKYAHQKCIQESFHDATKIDLNKCLFSPVRIFIVSKFTLLIQKIYHLIRNEFPTLF